MSRSHGRRKDGLSIDWLSESGRATAVSVLIAGQGLLRKKVQASTSWSILPSAIGKALFYRSILGGYTCSQNM